MIVHDKSELINTQRSLNVVTLSILLPFMDKGGMLVTLTFFAKTNYQLLSLISVNHHSVVLF